MIEDQGNEDLVMANIASSLEGAGQSTSFLVHNITDANS